jgi:NAD(P)-dependent dehydrogenase (short-subunit alcohol dehydrogenase family)
MSNGKDAPVILVTGALTGIGRATAIAFAKGGATVVAAGRREAEGKALETELRSLGAQAAFIKTDVRREDEVRHLVDETIARFGRLNVAVNSAGTEGKPGPLVEQTADTYAATFDTNVLGTLLSMKHELRVMMAQGGGSIVNISSTYGHEGAKGASIYAGSKHAVEGMTKSAALEAAGLGVRVNAVAPADRHRHAQSLYWHGGTQGSASVGRAAGPGRPAGGNRKGDRLPCLRRRVFRDRPDRHGRRWQDCRLIASRLDISR